MDRVCSVCAEVKGDYGYMARSDDTCVACVGRSVGLKREREDVLKSLKSRKRFQDKMAPILDAARDGKGKGRKWVYLTIPEFLELTEGLRDYPDALLT